MQSTLKQRVEELMKDVKIELPNEFATYIGMKRAQLLYDVLKGDVKNSKTVVDYITKKFQTINPEWISKGISPKEKPLSNTGSITELQARINQLETDVKVLEGKNQILSEMLDKYIGKK
jgi:ubiquinone biosynthesis protein UbiJ